MSDQRFQAPKQAGSGNIPLTTTSSASNAPSSIAQSFAFWHNREKQNATSGTNPPASKPKAGVNSESLRKGPTYQVETKPTSLFGSGGKVSNENKPAVPAETAKPQGASGSGVGGSNEGKSAVRTETTTKSQSSSGSSRSVSNESKFKDRDCSPSAVATGPRISTEFCGDDSTSDGFSDSDAASLALFKEVDVDEEIRPKNKEKNAKKPEQEEKDDPISYTTVDQCFDKYVDSQKLSVLLFGATGTGKSSLINCYFGEELATTGDGEPQTKGLHTYETKYAKLRLVDTEGFEFKAGQADTIRDELTRRVLSFDNPVHCCWFCIQDTGAKMNPEDTEFMERLNSYLPLIIVITQSESGQRSSTYRHFMSKYGNRNPVVCTRCRKSAASHLIGGESMREAMERILKDIRPERIERLKSVHELKRYTDNLHRRTYTDFLETIGSVLGDELGLYFYAEGNDVTNWRRATELPLVRACAKMEAKDVFPFLRFLLYCDMVSAFSYLEMPIENVSTLIDKIVDYVGKSFETETEIQKLVIPQLSSSVLEGVYDPKKGIKNILWFFLGFRQHIMDTLGDAILMAFSKKPTEVRRKAPDTNKVFRYFKQRLFGPQDGSRGLNTVWAACNVKEEMESNWGNALKDRLEGSDIPLGYLNGFVVGRDGDAYASVMELLSERKGWRPSLPVEYKRSTNSWLGLYLAQPPLEEREKPQVFNDSFTKIHEQVQHLMNENDPTQCIHFFWYCVDLDAKLSDSEIDKLEKIKRDTGIPVIVTYGNVRSIPQRQKLKLNRVNTTGTILTDISCLSLTDVASEIEKTIKRGSENAVFPVKYASIETKISGGHLSDLVSFFAKLASMTSIDKQSRRTYLFEMFRCLRKYTRINLSDKAMRFMSHFMSKKTNEMVEKAGNVFLEILDSICQDVFTRTSRTGHDHLQFQQFYVTKANSAGLSWKWDDD